MKAPVQPARVADLVIYNGRIVTQDGQRSFVTALGCSCFAFWTAGRPR
ncbi:hypothetical protein WN982_26915 [Paraburkholderia sp. IMGN_8]